MQNNAAGRRRRRLPHRFLSPSLFRFLPFVGQQKPLTKFCIVAVACRVFLAAVTQSLWPWQTSAKQRAWAMCECCEGSGARGSELTDKSLWGTKCVHSTACEDCDFPRLLEFVTYFHSQSVSLLVCLSICLSACLCLLACVHVVWLSLSAVLCQIESISCTFVVSCVCGQQLSSTNQLPYFKMLENAHTHT